MQVSCFNIYYRCISLPSLSSCHISALLLSQFIPFCSFSMMSVYGYWEQPVLIFLLNISLAHVSIDSLMLIFKYNVIFFPRRGLYSFLSINFSVFCLLQVANMKKEIDAIRVKDIAQGGLTQGQQTQIARNEQRILQVFMCCLPLRDLIVLDNIDVLFFLVTHLNFWNVYLSPWAMFYWIISFR